MRQGFSKTLTSSLSQNLHATFSSSAARIDLSIFRSNTYNQLSVPYLSPLCLPHKCHDTTASPRTISKQPCCKTGNGDPFFPVSIRSTFPRSQVPKKQKCRKTVWRIILQCTDLFTHKWDFKHADLTCFICFEYKLARTNLPVESIESTDHSCVWPLFL